MVALSQRRGLTPPLRISTLLIGALVATRVAVAEFAQFAMGVQNYTLPPLPYGYDALEPSISAEIMRLHHTKHHQAYVDNLNAANAKLTVTLEAKDVAGQAGLQEAIKFNAGGHINHSLFWKNLAPATSPEANPDAAPQLVADISAAWGDFAAFQRAFFAALLDIKGSGWGWLVKEEGRQSCSLRIVTTKDQDPPVTGMVPIFGVDMWEHAYYLQYQNGKAAYVKNIWSVLNWKTAGERYQLDRQVVLAAF